MKRIGAIYTRDASKSRDRAKAPLRDIDCNAMNENRRQKRWKMQLDNEPDSEEKSSYKEYSRPIYESDGKEITFSEPRQDSRAGQDDDVLKKMAALGRIIAELNKLKECSLKPSQQGKLIQIEDKLLQYQRKLLHNQKQNYL